MKKYNVVLVLIAILLGVSSCKKEELVVQTTKDYPITLWSNNDSKASIKPTQDGDEAVVNHELGDHIYLAYKGYCNNSKVRVSGIINDKYKFDGNLIVNDIQSEIPGDSPLFFYFLGGVYLKDKDNNWYETPNNVVGILADPITGEVANDNTRNPTLLYYIKGTEPNSENLEDAIAAMKEQ